MEISLQETENKGVVIAKEDDTKAGEMTYSVAGSELIIIDHTEIEPAYTGKGVGKQLLYKIVEMARNKGIKILPLCPFSNAMFKKLDDIKDVLK